MRSIHASSADYETWLGGHVRLIEKDITRKHEEMADDVFSFLRATFYRWAERWPKEAGDVGQAPVVLAVGDLHVENFGLWRDAEGRLVWGINDVDEAYPAPYTNDLVRLAVSAMLAAQAGAVMLDDRGIVEAIVDGYRRATSETLAPYVLAERHLWLRALALAKLKDPLPFWNKVKAAQAPDANDLNAVGGLLSASLPHPHGDVRFVHRIAGLGSLGRPRIAALAEWCGGVVCRETKAVAPSAWRWASGDDQPWEPVYIAQILADSVRCPDPYIRLREGWMIRRLAPDGSRIELADLPGERDDRHLLSAMGRETANVHLGLPRVRRRIAAHVEHLKSHAVLDAAKRMLETVEHDWHAWKAG